jgi:hypothetical protein
MKSQYQLSVKDLTAAVQNAKSEGVNSLLIQLNGVDYPLASAAIVPKRNHSDLTLFVGAPINKPAATKSFFSFGTKAKSPPLHKEITPAVIAIISQIVGSKISTNTLNEIKTALSEVNEHFETVDYEEKLDSHYPCDFKFGGGAL